MSFLETNIQNKVKGPSVSWYNSLDNVKVICNNFAIGTTNSETKMKEIITSYCCSLPCDFVKSHPSNLERKRERNCSSSRVLWEMKNIPYDGIPFCVLSHEILKCKFSMNYNYKKKKKQEDIKIKNTDEKKQLSHTLCAAKITIKKLKRFPSFSLSLKPLKHEKLEKLKKLKRMLDEKQNIVEEEIYWLCIPLPSYHNHDFKGKDRSVNKDIVEFIEQMVKNGIYSSNELRVLIHRHVQEMFKNCNNPPLFEDEAYYPTAENIRFIVYNFKKRKKTSKEQKFCPPERNIDYSNENPHNLKEKTSWKPNSLQDVVEAFCQSPQKDEQIPTFIVPPSQPTQSTVPSLREKISFEFARIINIVNTTDNVNKLEYILSCLQSLDNYEDSYI